MILSKTGFLHVNSRLTRQDVGALSAIEDGWCLSLFLPVQHGGAAADQAVLLLKDLDVKARRALALHSLSPREIETLLAPVERLLERQDFSHVHGRGFAVLASGSGSACFLLPEAPEPLVEVDRRFRLDPLLPALAGEDEFFLLALSLRQVRFYEGHRGGLREVPLQGSAIHAPKTPLFDKHSAMEFCREIDAAVRARIRDRNLPMLIAGVYPLLALYRKANAYPQLLEEGLVLNPEDESVRLHLHALAWERLKEARRRERTALLHRVREGLAGERVAAGIADVVPSACAGAVSHLLVQEGFAAWGEFDPATGRTRVVPVPLPRSENLVNLAALQTLLAGGRVHVLSPEEMPAGMDIAAVCRS